MSLRSLILPTLIVPAVLVAAVVSQATESLSADSRSNTRSHHGMKPMMGMMNMMAECERMMQMTDRYQSVPNQQWRNNPQQPERH